MKANNVGRLLEDVLAAVFTGVGLEFQRQVVVGKNIYEYNLRVDFVVRNLQQFPAGLIVESKWQDVLGSIDEKFPYLKDNIYLQYPLPTIVVVHGGGCRANAVNWLRAQCDGQHFIGVYGLEQFISWAIRAPKLTAMEGVLPL